MAANTDDHTTTTNESDESTAIDLTGQVRRPVIRLMLPGRHDPDNQLGQLHSLETAIKHCLKSENQLDMLEILLTPGDNQYEHYLTPIDLSQSTPTAPAEDTDKNKTTNSEQLTFATSAQPTTGTAEIQENTTEENPTDKNITGVVTNAIDDHCPEVEYQRGTLGLGSLTEIPVPTSRLLAIKDQTLDRATGAPSQGITQLLVELIERQIPHVYQLLLKRGSNQSSAEYQIVARLAVYDEEYGIATDADLSEHLDTQSSYSYDIATPFRDEITTSNFQLPIRRVKKLAEEGTSRRYQINGQPIYMLDEPFPLKQLSTFREYFNLLAGSFNSDPRYETHFKAFGNIPIHGSALDQLAMIIPAYFQYSLWDRTAVTDGPQFHTEVIPSSAESRQRLGQQTPAVSNTEQSASTDRSTSPPHRALVNYIIKYLIQQGYTILAVDQATIDCELSDPDPTTRSHFPGDSQPDIVAKKDGEITVFEAEINDSNPGAYLKNLQRAVHFDYPVVIVTEERDDLTRKFDQANQPFNETATTRPATQGVRLYNFSEEVVKHDNTTYLLPKGTTETEWFLNHEDTLTLIADGKTIAKGDPEEPVYTLSYQAPRCEQRGDEYVVMSASGEHLATYGSETAVEKDFTPIKMPFIPTQITYFDQIELRYKTGNYHLKRYYNNPSWAKKHRNTAGRRHKAARNEFIETHTVEADDKTLFIPEVREEYYYPWHAAQTQLDPPDQNWFSRDIRATFEASTKDSRDRQLLDRTWLYTPGLDPQFPDFVE